MEAIQESGEEGLSGTLGMGGEQQLLLPHYQLMQHFWEILISMLLPWHLQAHESLYMKSQTIENHGLVMGPKDGTLAQHLSITDVSSATCLKHIVSATWTR